MKISIKGFIYHKTAERYADCFDRYGINQETNKFAISDGVSKSFFPGIWAELLIDFFLNNKSRIHIGDTKPYKMIQSKWVEKVEEIVKKPNQKYFVRNFFIQGRPAAATFVGLHFFIEDNAFQWEAFALGDSFLFFIPEQIKNIENNFKKVTILSSKKDFEFNNFPDFFDSRNVISKGRTKRKSGVLSNGTFYLMTDALSEWFITQKQKALDEISKWENQDDFEKSIIQLRKDNLQNDDSAILIISIENDNSNSFNYTNISITNFDKLLEEEEIEMEKIRVVEERLRKEKEERERIEKERIEKEKIEKEKAENERARKEREEWEKIENERSELERIEWEKAEREGAEFEKSQREGINKESATKEKSEWEKAWEKAQMEKIQQEKTQREKGSNEKRFRRKGVRQEKGSSGKGSKGKESRLEKDKKK